MTESRKVILAGFISGFLIVLTFVLLIYGAFIFTGLFEIGMAKTHFLQNVLKGKEITGENWNFGVIFLEFIKAIFSLWKAFLIAGILGAAAAKFHQIEKRRERPISIAGFFETSYDYLFFFSLLIIASTLLILHFAIGNRLTFASFCPTEKDIYSFWSLSFVLLITSLFLAYILQRTFLFFYKFVSRKIVGNSSKR